MTTNYEPLLSALEAQDFPALDEAMGCLAEQLGDEASALTVFRNEVLPDASPSATEAFWRSAMTGDEFDTLIDDTVMAATHRLINAKMMPGIDFASIRRDDGLQQLSVNRRSMDVLMDQFTASQMSTLSIVLKLMHANEPA